MAKLNIRLLSISLVFFFAALLLIKLPPFYITTYTSKLFTTHAVAKLIFMGLFIFLVIQNRNRIHQIPRHIMIGLSIYFITQSLSVLGSNNVVMFLKQYQNIVFEIIILITSFLIVMKQKSLRTLIIFIILISFIAATYELLFVIFKNDFLSFFNNLIQTEIFDLYQYNFLRSRTNLYMNLELYIPIILFVIIYSSVYKSAQQKKFIVSLIVFMMNNYICEIILLLLIGLKFRLCRRRCGHG